MQRIIGYLKIISIFIIIELFITFFTSLLNLLNVNSGITSLLLFILNIVLFFILNIYNARRMKKRGFLEGLYLGIILILLMIIIKITLFGRMFNIATYIYYFILLLSSMFGGMLGINKKNDN